MLVQTCILAILVIRGCQGIKEHNTISPYRFHYIICRLTSLISWDLLVNSMAMLALKSWFLLAGVYFTCHTHSPLHSQKAGVSWRRMSTPFTGVVCKSTPLAGNTQRCAWISDGHIPSCYTKFKTNLLCVWKQKQFNANTNMLHMENKYYYYLNMNFNIFKL